MSVPSWTQSIDNMFTTTWAYRKSDAVAQAFYKTPFIRWLKEKNKVDEIRGFRRIEIPLEYGNNETVRWIRKGSTVPLTEGELFTMAYDDWKYVSVTILRYGVEDHQNRGKARIIPYVERKVRAAERALWEEFERVVFADGSGTDEPNGLRNLVATDPTTGTVHGIDRSVYTWFRNNTKQASGAASTYFASDMRNLLNTVTTYAMSEAEDLSIWTTQSVFEAYEDSLLEYFRISPRDKGDTYTKSTLSVSGVPLYWARSCPTGCAYVINPEYLKLVVDPDYFMDMTEWKSIPDQVNDRVAQITCALQFITTRPIACGVLHSIT